LLLRQAYGEASELVGGAGREGEKELVQRITEEHFPHRGVREVGKKMREEGFLEQQGKKSGGRRKRREDMEEGEGEGKKSEECSYLREGFQGEFCIASVLSCHMTCHMH